MKDFMMYADRASIIVLIYTLVYCITMLVSVIWGAFTSYKSIYLRELSLKLGVERELPPVSIIAPAFNEEVTVIDCVNNMLNIDYPRYEVIVVDDGSTDNTAQVLIDHFHLQPTHMPIRWVVPCNKATELYMGNVNGVDITLARKPNGKKADASNCGINIAKYPYIVDTDIDSLIQKDCLKLMIEEFLMDNKVVAVGGRIGISNGLTFKDSYPVKQRLPKNIFAALQVLEYDRSFLCARNFFNSFNGNMIISGALGMFRRDILLQVGGYRTDALGEDMDLTTRIHRYCKENHIPYTMKYVPEAICWTQAPSSLGDLKKQRQRWYIGLTQVMSRYQNFLNFSYVYYFLFELLAPFIEAIGIIMILLSVIFHTVNFPPILILMGICASFGALITLTSYATRNLLNDHSLTFVETLKAIGLCIFEIIIWKPIYAFMRVAAVFKPKKKKYAWDALKREKMDIK